MCKECDWNPHNIALHKCDCGSKLWVKGAKQEDEERVLFRCVKCDALYLAKYGFSSKPTNPNLLDVSSGNQSET